MKNRSALLRILAAIAAVTPALAQSVLVQPAKTERLAQFTTGGIFPYFADGGGWTTTFFITCASPQCVFQFVFIGSSGAPVAVPVRIFGRGEAGDLELRITESTLNVNLGLWESVLIETLGAGAGVTTGGIDVQSAAALAGFATLRQRVPGRPDYEASVAMENRIFYNSAAVAFDNRTGATGVAITNLTNNQRADIVVTGVDLGDRLLFTALISLEASRGITFDVASRYPETAGKAGLLRLTTQSAVIGGAAFQFNPSGPFTTIPVFGFNRR
jgi:hypothetical protein